MIPKACKVSNFQGLVEYEQISNSIIRCKFKSMFGAITETDIPITLNQLQSFLSGTSIQVAFPNVPPQLRELFLSGMDDDTWKSVFDEIE